MCFYMLQFYTVKLQVKEEVNELPINIYIYSLFNSYGFYDDHGKE